MILFGNSIFASSLPSSTISQSLAKSLLPSLAHDYLTHPNNRDAFLLMPLLSTTNRLPPGSRKVSKSTNQLSRYGKAIFWMMRLRQL